MELHTKLRENNAYHHPLLLSDQNYNMKPFHFEASSISKGDYYLQDLDHHLDDQTFHVNVSSSRPTFGSQQTPCFEYPYEPYNTYMEPTNLENQYSYESKPFVVDQNGGHGHVMDNFQLGVYSTTTFSNRNPMDLINGPDCLPLNLHGQESIIIKPLNFVVPDEVSCVTAENGYYNKVGGVNKNRTSLFTRRTSKTRKKTNVVKGQWTVEEDRVLVQLVEEYGVRKWSHIAQMLAGRIGKQCRERWHNHLRPDIKKDTWSEEEDKILIEAHAEIGNKWAEIAKRLQGRTENSIKNHWNATKRRQYSKRKCRSKYPRGSLLQDYIKSLNLDSLNNTTGRSRRKTTTITCATSNTNTGNDTTLPQPTEDDQPQKTLEFCPDEDDDDRLVPNYDFNEDPDFCFDENIFQEGCTIESLLDDIPCASNVLDGKNVSGYPTVEDNNFLGKIIPSIEKYYTDMEINAPVVLMKVGSKPLKKEMDLVEMITQVNEVVK